MSLLQVEQLSHTYGDKTIFHQASFRLLRGEHIGLVGSNGAGKSTLLRILAGELIADAGKLEWQAQLTIGYLQQHLGLLPGHSIKQVLQSAFSSLYRMEERLLTIAEEMTAAGGDRLERLLAQYGELQQRLEDSGFYEIETHMAEVAHGLGLLELGPERDVAALSGGQRTKLLLAKLLLEQPDVLLLDEPTNFLDDAHIEWLIGYLKSYEQAYLVISHDEHFLNEVTTAILHVDQHAIRRYAGNYEAFRRTFDLGREQLQSAYDRQQKEIQKLESFIQKNKVRNAKQAKSREKMLGRLSIIEKPAQGPPPRFRFHVHAEPVPQVLQANRIEVGYTTPLFKPVDLRVARGAKIAITGYNGIGKSTMLKTLLGELPPLGGTVKRGERVQGAYFAQETVPPVCTPFDHLATLRPDLTNKDLRRLLASAGLNEQHIRQPVASLSGGEQAKVRLCELMAAKSNMLLLDEPTNHLDARAKEALREALIRYEGTIILVSHEPSFYEDWVTQVWRVQEWGRA
ncbi:ATPase subunit of ABC transporter with duplicated ATPase domains [Paenibacillus phyllosphaerae]|uniref:ATPase subunit of ABC transporter with duplicated ATPase domains n=1 Tax=Paenibacillus phyllosphaerae TaxID=274593 RepID=A0A7W5AXH2_9BACL|nr:ABC-F family ATP-binding cassette domain-containing protein [Paenibacillus phyllosphaerae]MBB3110274.1 ATPase subunit of ABC transporter with duplicated ATPase domains [Paenibacillus phyllosphaerae]